MFSVCSFTLVRARDGGDGVFGDVELDAFGLQQRDILLDERILRLGQTANKIFFLQRLQLDANGQAALKLGDQSDGLVT